MRKITASAALAVCALSLLATTDAAVSAETGVASFYGAGHHGRRTASGERFNRHAMTAAHRRLPFGTRVKVVNLLNGRSVTVRINDRGPFHRGRNLDVSEGAARVLGFVARGSAPVRIIQTASLD